MNNNSKHQSNTNPSTNTKALITDLNEVIKDLKDIYKKRDDIINEMKERMRDFDGSLDGIKKS